MFTTRSDPGLMRHAGDWMSLADDRILEYIHDNDRGTPKEMVEEGPIHYTPQHVARRCRKLADEGLLQHFGNSVYVITDAGEAYLDGRLDTQNWIYLDEDGEPTGQAFDGAASAEIEEEA